MTAMSAITRDDGDLVDPILLLREVQESERRYREVKKQLPEFKRQFLEAKRRYRHFQELVLLSREIFIRRLARLEELARLEREASDLEKRAGRDDPPE